MIDFEKVTRFFNNESIYCFTSDLDWAPELAIKETLTLFNSLEVPLTPFITHNSDTINKYYGKNRKAQYVGLHPNFLPNSSHGNNYMQQIDFVINLWPDAKCFRSHSYFDNSKITHEFYKRGFRYDSNICLFLHPYCTPLRHQSDLIRFPVFWEDDAHWERYPFKLNTKDFKKYIDIPGLKIFNFHPLNTALNIPSSDYYKKHKFLYHKKIEEPADLLRYKFKGAGVQTFLENLISYLKKKRVRFYYLHDLYLSLCEKFPANKR
jgi:hypothetical protein